MGKRARTPSLRVKLFLTVNAVVLVVTAAGLAFDVPRQYRAFHRLLYEQLLDDARVWQIAWARADGQEQQFQQNAKALRALIGENDARDQIVIVVGPKQDPNGQAVLAWMPDNITPGLRQCLIDHADDPHSMASLDGRRLMVVSLP
ncbi:MAG: hypothetical protein PHU85_16000, partial [Phycisphaerae bacterium]|nr:hypothetical protein [Phycisphaerae bacterium]